MRPAHLQTYWYTTPSNRSHTLNHGDFHPFAAGPSCGSVPRVRAGIAGHRPGRSGGRLPLVAAVCATLAGVAGCRSYEARALDLTAHAAAWRARTSKAATALEDGAAVRAGIDVDGFELSDGVELSEALALALVFNPDLRQARARAGVATSAAREAGLWSDPQVGVEALRIAESVSDPWVSISNLSFSIPLSDRLAAARELGGANVDQALAGVAAAEWELVRNVRQAWAAWSGTVRSIAALEAFVAALDELSTGVQGLVDSGELPRTEAALFGVERARQAAAALRLQGQRAAAELELRALLGLAPEAELKWVPADITSKPDPAGSGLGQAWIERHPRLVERRAAYEVAEQRLRLQIARQWPDLLLGPQFESDSGQSRIGFVAGIPVPVFNANRQGIARAEAGRELVRVQCEVELERIGSRLAIARGLSDNLALLRAEYEQQVLPLAERQLEDALALLQIGEGSSLLLLQSLTRSLGAELDWVTACADLSANDAELRYWTGPPSPPEMNELQERNDER